MAHVLQGWHDFWSCDPQPCPLLPSSSSALARIPRGWSCRLHCSVFLVSFCPVSLGLLRGACGLEDKGRRSQPTRFSVSLLSGAALWLQLLSAAPSLSVCPPDCSLSLLSGQRQPSVCQTSLDCLLPPGHRLLNTVPTSVISSQNDTASGVATQCDSFP